MFYEHLGQGGCRQGTFLLCLQYGLPQAPGQFLSEHN
jgi:hypothetical protein